MLISTLFAALGIALGVTSVVADPISTVPISCAQILPKFYKLIALSESLCATANRINYISGSLYFVSQGPYEELAKGFKIIIDIMTDEVAALANNPPFEHLEDEISIRDVLRTFVRVQHDILIPVTTKAKLRLDRPTFAHKFAEELKLLDVALDTFILRLVELCPVYAPRFILLKESLDSLMDHAINLYSPPMPLPYIPPYHDPTRIPKTPDNDSDDSG